MKTVAQWTLENVGLAARMKERDRKAVHELMEMAADHERAEGLRKKLLFDTGKGCSVCGHTPVVNVDGTYWLCGECVSEKLPSSPEAALEHDLGRAIANHAADLSAAPEAVTPDQHYSTRLEEAKRIMRTVQIKCSDMGVQLAIHNFLADDALTMNNGEAPATKTSSGFERSGPDASPPPQHGGV